MRATTVTYCQVCTRNFKNNEIVYYVTIDNSIVCANCANQASELTDDIKPRIYEGYE